MKIFSQNIFPSLHESVFIEFISKHFESVGIGGKRPQYSAIGPRPAADWADLWKVPCEVRGIDEHSFGSGSLAVQQATFHDKELPQRFAQSD